LVVIYKNELDLNEKLRNISVYDGYKVVSSGSNSVNIYIDGFLTPTNGDVNSILSVFAAEGENIYSGDDITVEGKTPPGAVSGNAFDSSISGFDANPSYRNANGIDIDIYDLNSDPSNQIIANEQSSATINLDSGGDAYFPSLVVFTTELYQPRVCYAQTLLDKDGNPFTESPAVGDIITVEAMISNMKLDERRKPQDGRFSAHIENRLVDFRVSTFPASYGEKVVMRILETEKGIKKLEETGLSKDDLEKVRRAINKPYGMILISGPTGSGKSTTLYALLNEMDRESKNILSLEDPVEFNIDGVSQSQVHPEIGYTFASGLRTTLRQDPDVIMVGEIRDKETAVLAVQAALTGHLVLSTIHTNNAIGVIPRLVEMGVDPFLIAPTLILSVAQRLVRTLCPNSGEALPVEGSVKMMIDKELSGLPEEVRNKIKIPKNVYKAVSSPECPAGTRGRIAVFEIIETNHEIEEAILTDYSGSNIEKIVRKHGFLTMKEDALLKAFDGKIPFEEVNML